MKTNRQTVLKLRRWASALFIYLLSGGRSMEKRERILEEAEKLFSQKGYYGLSLSELLARCDIPKGSFYYYFPQGKIQLIQETLRYSYNKMINGIRKNLFTQKTALAAYERMAEYLAKDLLGKGYFHRISLPGHADSGHLQGDLRGLAATLCRAPGRVWLWAGGERDHSAGCVCADPWLHGFLLDQAGPHGFDAGEGIAAPTHWRSVRCRRKASLQACQASSSNA